MEEVHAKRKRRIEEMSDTADMVLEAALLATRGGQKAAPTFWKGILVGRVEGESHIHLTPNKARERWLTGFRI